MGTQIEKHYISFIKDYLYNYNQHETYINNLEKEIEGIRAGDESLIKSILYEAEKISPTNKISSPTENIAIRRVDLLKELEDKLNYSKRFKEKIDIGLHNLKADNQEIVFLKIFDNMKNYEIAEKTYYNRNKVKKLLEDSFESIAISVFGFGIDKKEDNLLKMALKD